MNNDGISLYSLQELTSQLTAFEGQENSRASRLLQLLQSGQPQQVLCFQADGNTIAAIGLNVDREGIALLGPIVVLEPITEQTRLALWELGVDACLSQSVRALQLAADDTTSDRSILAQLGYPITTEIGLMNCLRIPQLVANDPDVVQVSIADQMWFWTNLVGETFAESNDLPEALPLRQPALMIDGWLSQGGVEVWAATAACGPVGLLVAHRNGEVMEMTYVGLVGSHRRQRWGTRLVEQFLKWCGENGIMTVTVMIDRRNQPAISLYQRFGFQDPRMWMPVVFHVIASDTESAQSLP